MALYVKGLAGTVSTSNFRFQNAADRAEHASSSIARRVRADHERTAAPATGDAASFFREELNRWRELEISSQFGQFAREVTPLSQSLAQLVHHKDAVVSLTLAALENHNESSWRPLLALTGVLARDLRSEIYPHFERIASTLRRLVDPAQPELTAEVFRAVSFTFKYLFADILGDAAFGAHFDAWLPCLGHKKKFVRELTAASLALLLRKQTLGKAVAHIAAVLRSTSVVQGASLAASALSRSPELKDGTALLLYELVRGVKGSFHSAAPSIIAAVLAAIAPKRKRVVELASGPSGGALDAYTTSLALRFEIVSQALRYMCEHTAAGASTSFGTTAAAASRSKEGRPQDGSAKRGGAGSSVVTGVAWDALLEAVETHTRAWQEEDAKEAAAATAAAPAAVASGRSGKQKASGGAVGSSVAAAAASRPPSSLSSAYCSCLSLHTAQLCGLLRDWLAYRGGRAVPAAGRARLADVMRRLCAPRIWLSLSASPLSRRATLAALLCAWPLISMSSAPAAAARRPGGKGRFAMDEEDEGEGGGEEAAGRRGLHGSGGDGDAGESEEGSAATPSPLVVKILGHVFSVCEDRGGEAGEGEAAPRDHFTCATLLTAAAVGLEPRAATASSASSGGALDAVLHFSRSLLAQETAPGKLTAAPHRAPLALAALLPHVRTLVARLVDAAATVPRACELLLQLQDALLPLVATGRLEQVCASAPGVLTETGRLELQREGEAAGATPTAHPFVRSLGALAAALEGRARQPGAVGLLLPLPVLVDGLVIVRATAAVVLPPASVFPALLAVFQAAGGALDAGAGAPAAAPHPHHSTVLLLHLLRAAALTNISALLAEESEGEAPGGLRAPPDLCAQALDWVGAYADALQGGGHVERAAVAETCGVPAGQQLFGDDPSSEQDASAAPPGAAPPLLLDGAAPTAQSMRSIAVLLPALEAAALLLETVTARSQSSFGAVAAALAAPPGSAAPPVAPHPSELQPPSHLHANTACAALAWTLSFPDHSLRLCALRVLTALPQPDFLGEGVRVPTVLAVAVRRTPGPGAAPALSSKPSGKESSKTAAKQQQRLSRAADPQHQPSPAPTAQFDERPLSILHDPSVVAAVESSFTGPSPAVALMHCVESLPLSLANERAMVQGLERLATMTASRRLPSQHVLLAIHHGLGLLHGRFAPLWPAATALLVAASHGYPRTLWGILGHQLFLAMVRRPNLGGSGGGGDTPSSSPGEDGAVRGAAHARRPAPAPAPGAVSRSQSRTDRERAYTQRLRDGAELMRQALSGGGVEASSSAQKSLAASVHEDYGEEEAGVASTAGVGGGEEGRHLSAALGTLASMLASGLRGSHYSPSPSPSAAAVLRLGEGGRTDPDTHHKTLLGMLAAAPLFAESRSRILVPLFLTFLRDDLYGGAGRGGAGPEGEGDPDAAELRLPARLTELHARRLATLGRRAAAGAGDASATAAEPGDEVLARLVGGAEAPGLPAAPQARSRLTRTSLSSRLLSFLGLLEKFKGWGGGVFGQPLLLDCTLRLCGKVEHGVAEAALRLLLSMRLPGLAPLKDSLLRLLRDDSYREEMTILPLLPASKGILPEHRPGVLGVIFRLLFGRLLQRKGHSARDTPASRRATIMGYLAAVADAEVHPVLYLAMRPFLLPLVGALCPAAAGPGMAALQLPAPTPAAAAPGPAAMSSPHHSTSTEVEFSRVVPWLRAPASPDAAARLAQAMALSFSPKGSAPLASSLLSEGTAGAAPLRYLTGPRAVGFLNLLHDMVRYFGLKLEQHVHIPLAATLALLGECWGDGAEGSTGTATSVSASAKEIRPLALLRLRDLLTAYPSYDYRPWLPMLHRTLQPLLPSLPATMAHAAKPSALLLLLAAMAAKPALRGLLCGIPGAVPALWACLSAGLPGSPAVYAEHRRAEGGAAPSGSVSGGAGGGGRSGPSLPVLTIAFDVVECLLGMRDEGPQEGEEEPGAGSGSGPPRRGLTTEDFLRRAARVTTRTEVTQPAGSPLGAQILPHIPHLLRHFAVRLAANVTVAPGGPSPAAAPAAQLAPLAAADAAFRVIDCRDPVTGELIVPTLKKGSKAFARRQLAVLWRLSEHAVSAGSGKAQDRHTMAQLVTLLLPYLKMRPARAPAPSSQPRFGGAHRSAGSSGVSADDTQIVVTRIIQRLVPQIPDPLPFLPFFTGLLAPGPQAILSEARSALLGVIRSLTSHACLAHLEPVARALEGTATMSGVRLGELNYDAVLGCMEFLGSAATVAALLLAAPAGPGTTGLLPCAPAVIHQLAHLMHDGDMACRTAAANILAALTTAAAKQAASPPGPGEAPPPHPPAAAPGADEGDPDADGLLPRGLPFGAAAPLPPPVAAATLIARVLVPDLRVSLATVSPHIRRGFVVLLSDVVAAFSPPHRFSAHPAFHTDLCVLRNPSDPEADVFANLVHVQVHRRARAFLKLSGLVESGALGAFSIRTVILPLTLHALYDEAGSVGETAVETKGRSAKLRSGPSYAGGLHAEAVKLIGAVARVLPWGAYISTLRSLSKQVGAVPPALDRVLSRAVAAIADSFHFGAELQAPPSEGAPSASGSDTAAAAAETELARQLNTVIDTGGATARRLHAELSRQVTDGPLAAPGGPAAVEGEGGRGAASAPASRGRGKPTAPVLGAWGTTAPKRRGRAAAAEEEEGRGRQAGTKRGRGSKGQARDAPLEDEEEEEKEEEGAVAEEEAAGDTAAVDADDASSVSSSASSLDASAATDAQLLSSAATAGLSAAANERRKCLLTLATYVIPALDKQLYRAVDANSARHRGALKEEGELRAPIASALLVMLLAMPPAVFAAQLPGMLARLCTALKSRDQHFRDSARATIARVASRLGPAHLSSVLSALSTALLKEGFEMHVAGHALYAVLEALVPTLSPAPPSPPPPQRRGGAAKEEVEEEVYSLSDASAALVRCLPQLLDLIMDDVLGAAAEARAVGSGYAPKSPLAEAKICRGYDSMQIVARCVPFLPCPSVHTITARLSSTLERAVTTGKPTDTVDTLFKRVLAGLASNPSVTPHYLLLYVHAVCTDYLHCAPPAPVVAPAPSPAAAVETGAGPGAMQAWIRPKHAGKAGLRPLQSWSVRLVGAADDAPAASSPSGVGAEGVAYLPLSAAMRRTGKGVLSQDPDAYTVLPEPRMTGVNRYSSSRQRAANSGASSVAETAMGAFALALMLAGAKNGRITSTDPAQLRMMDPFVPLLLGLLGPGGAESGGCKDSRVIVLALRLLTLLLPYPLPSTRRLCAPLTRSLLAHLVAGQLSSSSAAAAAAATDPHTARSELATAATKAVTVLLRACDFARVTEDQLRALLVLLSADLATPSRQNATYALLKAIVARRFVVAEVYDVMDAVSRQLVTSIRPHARSLCASVLLTFLLKYPMTDGKLQAHLEFFVANLGYELEDGRAAVLDMLQAVVSRFPQPVLDDLAAFLLLPLTVRLAADPSPTCRAAVGALIKGLFRAVGARTAHELAALPLQWLGHRSPSSGDAAAAVPSGVAMPSPGLLRSGAQVLGLVAEARPEALGTLLAPLTSRLCAVMLHAASDVAAIEAQLRGRAFPAAPASDAPLAVEVEVEVAGEESEEGREARGSSSEAARVAALLSSSGDADARGADEEEGDPEARPSGAAELLDEGEEGQGGDPARGDNAARPKKKKKGKPTVTGIEARRALPAGTAGGVDAEFEAVARAAAPGASSSARRHSTPAAVSIDLPWEPVYYALVAAEKVLTALPDKAEAVAAAAAAASSSGGTKHARAAKLYPRGADLEVEKAALFPGGRIPLAGAASLHDVCAASAELLLYPHAWVRVAAARVLSVALARWKVDSITPASMSPSAPLARAWLHNPAAASTLARRVCAQLTSPHLGPALAELCAKNLLALSLALFRLTPEAHRSAVHAIVAAGHAADCSNTSGAGVCGPVEGGSAAFPTARAAASTADGDDDDAGALGGMEEDEEAAEGGEEDRLDEDDEDEEGVQGRSAAPPSVDLFYRLLDRVCGVAQRASGTAVAAVLKWLAAFAVSIPPADMRRYVVPCARLLYRLTTNEERERSLTPEARSLAQEALDLLQSTVGAQAFLRPFNAERARVNTLRLQRRASKATLRVTDPAEAARQKEKRQRAKLRQKKRKAESFRATKGKGNKRQKRE